jgi:putative membrane protein
LILREISITELYWPINPLFLPFKNVNVFFDCGFEFENLLKVENSLLIEIVLFITSSVFYFWNFQLFQTQKIHIAKQKTHRRLPVEYYTILVILSVVSSQLIIQSAKFIKKPNCFEF